MESGTRRAWNGNGDQASMEWKRGPGEHGTEMGTRPAWNGNGDQASMEWKWGPGELKKGEGQGESVEAEGDQRKERKTVRGKRTWSQQWLGKCDWEREQRPSESEDWMKRQGGSPSWEGSGPWIRNFRLPSWPRRSQAQSIDLLIPQDKAAKERLICVLWGGGGIQTLLRATGQTHHKLRSRVRTASVMHCVDGHWILCGDL